MTYRSPPILTRENFKFLALVAASLIALWAVNEAIEWFSANFTIPHWLRLPAFVFNLIIFAFPMIMAAWHAWTTDAETVDFEESQKITHDRAACIFVLIMAALFALLKYYSE